MVTLLCLSSSAVLSSVVLIVLWIQEGVYRTFQARIGVRILRIEELLRESVARSGAYQLHSEWFATRARGTALLREYMRSMLKPTVAFPYAALIVFDVFAAFADALYIA